MKTKEQQLEKLFRKESELEERLHKALLRENEVMNRMGWGHGMRCVKSSFSTRKSDALRERLEKVRNQIKELKQALS